jgi:hypothetical protein
MAGGPTRRDFVRGLGAGALIVGFDPTAGRWVSGDEKHHAVPIPPIVGQLLFDEGA